VIVVAGFTEAATTTRLNTRRDTMIALYLL